MSFLTCFWDLPQKEHFRRSPPSPMRATYDPLPLGHRAAEPVHSLTLPPPGADAPPFRARRGRCSHDHPDGSAGRSAPKADTSDTDTARTPTITRALLRWAVPTVSRCANRVPATVRSYFSTFSFRVVITSSMKP